jgi:hypothetical protein
MFIQSVLIVESLRKNEPFLKKLQKTIEEIIETTNKYGHLPLSLDDPKSFCVTMCHGSPGVIPLFTEAIKIFPHMQ